MAVAEEEALDENLQQFKAPTCVRVLQGIALLALGIHLASTLIRSHGQVIDVFDVWVIDICYASATLSVVLRPILSGVHRRAWTLFGAAMVSWFGGQMVDTLLYVHLNPAPYPSAADALWLAFLPLVYAALALLARSEGGRLHASSWFDGIVGGLAAASVAAALAFGAIVEASDGPPSAVATNLAYPAGDLLLLVILSVSLASFGWRPSRAWWWLSAGLLVFALADTLYCWQLATETYLVGTPLDSIWPLGFLLMGLAAWSPPRARRAKLDGWAGAVVPLASITTALGVLVHNSLRQDANLGIVLAGSAILIAAVRMTFTFRELRALADSHRLARTDELTGLLNRRGLSVALSALVNAGTPGTLMLMDLDRFKEVNDTFGHPSGDALLNQVGSRLSAIGGSSSIARLGGDEFALVTLETGEAARVLAEQVLGAVAETFDLGVGVRVSVGASVGLVSYPEHASDSDGLMRRADIAMYHTKKSRTRMTEYSAQEHEEQLHKLRLVDELRTGIARGELEVHYQPKVDAASRELVGAEALVRWRHPSRGLVMPDAFVELAEASGLMPELTASVAEQAVRQAARWLQGGREVAVAINLSPSSLMDKGLTRWVRTLLESYGLPAQLLVLEITEGVLMKDPAAAHRILSEVSAMGVKIAIDDFGTGYSSLSYLRNLPVDELKLDRSFVTDVSTNERTATLVGSTIALAHALGFTLVVEGVEDASSMDRVRDLGADLVQGFHVSKPVSVSEFEAWMAPSIPSQRRSSGAAAGQETAVTLNQP